MAVADTPELRERGLRGVTELSWVEGMVFEWEEEVTTPFSMPGALMALDVALVSERGQIIEVLSIEPCDHSCPEYTPSFPYRYALAARHGAFDALGGDLQVRGLPPITLTEIATTPVYQTESGYPMVMGWHPTDPNVTVPYSPHPEWQGGDSLEIGEPWRYWVTIDGCGFEFLYFNGVEWKQSERTYQPGTDGVASGLGDHYTTHDYPDSWDVYELPSLLGSIIQVDGVITLVRPERIEATTLEGHLIAVYEPTNEARPYCGA